MGWCTRWKDNALCIASREAERASDCLLVWWGSKSFSPLLGILVSSPLFLEMVSGKWIGNGWVRDGGGRDIREV